MVALTQMDSTLKVRVPHVANPQIETYENVDVAQNKSQFDMQTFDSSMHQSYSSTGLYWKLSLVLVGSGQVTAILYISR